MKLLTKTNNVKFDISFTLIVQQVVLKEAPSWWKFALILARVIDSKPLKAAADTNPVWVQRFLPGCPTGTAGGLSYLYLHQLYFSIGIYRICLPSKKYFSHLLKCISRLFTEELLPASPADIYTAGRVLSASSASGWHDVDSASSTNISYIALYLALAVIVTLAIQVM